ncbi:SDR family oxidoreductase [Oceanicoccus sagamiensis]|uniref:Short-chain dehydrogenase n=1 Tax=Oceanicoccus sagamiensis TaxID=716816 RepID=A0A1X9N7M9_9GAMM|nr:SDR family oxidoreductase [Oceanicoccus sagamiensis]ARN73124.1 short-chain dehydrogenase [Oceanicoccus sagamiensis]
MDNKVMLITGATSGIGKATAIKAAQQGIQLILTGRRVSLLNELVSEIGKENAIAIAADATQLAELSVVIAQGVQHWGKLDIAFANAGTGISTPGTEMGDPEEWQQMLAININALLWTAKLSLPHLRQQQGHFLLTSSVAGRTITKGSVYGASKWFAYGFAMNLAEEMEEWGGRCTTICPGMVNTPFFEQAIDQMLAPEDVADAALYAIHASPRNTVREVFLTPTR